MQQTTPTLFTVSGNTAPLLESVKIHANIRAMHSDIHVEQVYHNLESSPVEIVYTFPLPPSATLLNIQISLNQQVYTGEVQIKQEAESSYSSAIEKGHSALLLERTPDGLYTLRLGNLLANERAHVAIHYCLPHQWNEHCLALRIPTTLAPRYGDPGAAGYTPHQVPVHSLDKGPELFVSAVIEGQLAQCQVECPSHATHLTSQNDGLHIRWDSANLSMDRDIILNLSEPPQQPYAEAFWAKDGGGFVAMACFHPKLPEKSQPQPRRIVMMIDCSASMTGDSIHESREAAQQIVSLLQAGDSFNIITFGSSPSSLFDELVPARQPYLSHAQKFLTTMDANMGGTEMAAALELAVSHSRTEGLAADILLLTDGEIYDTETVLNIARNSGQRVFPIGLGSAVSANLLMQLAEQTRGACEFISPNEEISSRVLRHFLRMTQAPSNVARIEWPSPAQVEAPKTLNQIYSGDSIIVYAWFSKKPEGQVLLSAAFEGHQEIMQAARLRPATEIHRDFAALLPRLGAKARLNELSLKQQETLALTYQLLTQDMAYVMVIARASAQQSLIRPTLRKVAQPLPKGWGGRGTARSDRSFAISPSRLSDGDVEDLVGRPSFIATGPVFRRRATPEPSETNRMMLARSKSGLERLFVNLNTRIQNDLPPYYILHLITLSDLGAYGLPQSICDDIRALIDEATTEYDIVWCFLGLLAAAHDQHLSTGERHTYRSMYTCSGIDSFKVTKLQILINQMADL